MKWCPDCQVQKPFSDFPKNKATQDGYAAYCKPHHNERGKASLGRNGGAKNYHLRRRYQMDALAWQSMVDYQFGTCANPACDNEPTQVDHDHACCDFNPTKTEQPTCGCCTRGILCLQCNSALGQVKDNEKLLEGLIEYLQKWR